MVTTKTETCPSCTEPANLACAGCGDIKYCSAECQQTDWPAHKLLCRTFKTMADSERPNPRMRRVLFFPQDSTNPQFLWKEIIDYHDPSGILRCQRPKMAPEIDTKYSSCDLIDTNPTTGIPFDPAFGIDTHHNNGFPAKFESDNQAIASATKGFAQHPWRGPLLAFCGYGTSPTEKDIVNVTDMGMKEYSHVVAYLIDAYNNSKVHAVLKGPKIQAVKVFCDGEMQANGGLRFQAVKVPRRHLSVVSGGDYSSTSRMINMPLVIAECKTSRETDRTNQSAATMGMRDDANANQQPGTVFIFREDFAPLDVETVKVFSAFCSHVCAWEFQDTDVEPEYNTSAEGWARFQADWKKDKTTMAPMSGEEAERLQEEGIKEGEDNKLIGEGEAVSQAVESGGDIF